MTETPPPPRRPLAAFLRSATPETPATEAAPLSPPAAPRAPADTPADLTPAPGSPDSSAPLPPARAELGGPVTVADAGAARDPVPPLPVAAPAAAAPTAFDDAPTAAAPAFAQRGRRAPRMPARAWHWALLAALALLLGVQVLVADRARLAADARWRPLVGGLCGVLRCTLPAWREPAAFTMLDRDVRPLAAPAGVLQVQASFRNDGRWAQAWPWLQLSLSDADGRVIGSHVFAPQDYLGHAVAADDTLAPGQGAQIAFRVREPAANTAAFTFEFR